MLKKYLDIILVVLLFFVLIIFFIPRDKFYIVENVLSPTNFSGWTKKSITKAPLWFINEIYENFGIAYDVRHKKFYSDESQRA